MSDELRLSKEDPAFKAFVEIVETLDPFDRDAQLRILSAVCMLRGDLDWAELFAKLARQRVTEASP